MRVSCYAAMAKGAELEPFEYAAPELGDFDVRVEISHCGVCYGDVHMIDDDLGIAVYPFVPGHEAIGTVTEIGSKVVLLNVGDRVGIGWQARSCGHCPECLGGNENRCVEMAANATWTPYGGFADTIAVNSRFALPIPEPIDSEHAASLMCGGITVYEPLRRFAEPAMTVGVVGIGGLGHLALKFAAAYGCEVIAFSSSKDKRNDAKAFGAHEFVLHTDAVAMAKFARTLDIILMTAHADLEWPTVLSLLKPLGKMVILGIPPQPITLLPIQVIFGQLWVGGTAIGSPNSIRQMLDFTARHDLMPQIEILPMEKVNEAIAKLKSNKARYRMVLERA